MWVGVEGEGLVGVLGLKDRLRQDAVDTVRRLGELGIRCVIVVSCLVTPADLKIS